MLTGTHSASPSRNASRTPSRVHSISEEAVGPAAAPYTGPVTGRQGQETGRKGASMPVASLLEALKEDNERTEPETFEVSCPYCCCKAGGN